MLVPPSLVTALSDIGKRLASCRSSGSIQCAPAGIARYSGAFAFTELLLDTFSCRDQFGLLAGDISSSGTIVEVAMPCQHRAEQPNRFVRGIG